MRFLTLWPEWAWAVALLGKPVENRTWEPTHKTLKPGERFAIHAGMNPGGGSNRRLGEQMARIGQCAALDGWTVRLRSRSVLAGDDELSFHRSLDLVARDPYHGLDFTRGATTHTLLPHTLPTGRLVALATYGGAYTAPGHLVKHVGLTPAFAWFASEVEGNLGWALKEVASLDRIEDARLHFRGGQGLRRVPAPAMDALRERRLVA